MTGSANPFERSNAAVTSFIQGFYFQITGAASEKLRKSQPTDEKDQQAFLAFEKKAKKIFDLFVLIQQNNGNSVVKAWNILGQCKEILNGKFDHQALSEIHGLKSTRIAAFLLKPMLKQFNLVLNAFRAELASIDFAKVEISWLEEKGLLFFFGVKNLEALRQKFLAGALALQTRYQAQIQTLTENIKAYDKAEFERTQKANPTRDKEEDEKSDAAPAALTPSPNATPILPATVTEPVKPLQPSVQPALPNKASMPRYFALLEIISRELNLYRKSDSALFKYSLKDEYHRTQVIEADIVRSLRSDLQDIEVPCQMVRPTISPEVLSEDKVGQVVHDLQQIKNKSKITREDLSAAIHAIESLAETDRRTGFFEGKAVAEADAEIAKITARYSKVISAEDRYIHQTLQSLYHHHYVYLVKSNSSSALRSHLETIFASQGFEPNIKEINTLDRVVGERLATIPKLIGKAVKTFGRAIAWVGGSIEPVEALAISIQKQAGLGTILASAFRSVVGGAIRAIGNFFQGLGGFFHTMGKDLAADANRYQVKLVKRKQLSTTARLAQSIPIVRPTVNRVPEQSVRIIPRPRVSGPTLSRQAQSSNHAPQPSQGRQP